MSKIVGGCDKNETMRPAIELRSLGYDVSPNLLLIVTQVTGSGSGTDSDASGPVTRKKMKNKRRVSFGAHIGTR